MNAKGIATVLILMTTAASATRGAGQVPQQLPPRVTIDTLNAVTVQNMRKVPVTVYLEYGAFDRRLGIVKALGTDTLRLPDYAVKGHRLVQLFVHPAGALQDLETQRLSLKAPARLLLVVPPRGRMTPEPRDTMLEVIPPEALDDATITVDNPRKQGVTILAEKGGFGVRLGQVPAGGRATLRFPKSVLRDDRSMVLIVHPEGGSDLGSQLLKVKPGEHLGLRVPLH